MLFNATTLEPTYVFALGVPGQSLALALARTMALDARVVARAEALIGVDAQNLEQTFARLAADRERLEEMRKDLERQQRSTQERERDLRKRIESLEQEKEAFVRRAAAELAAAVEAVRQQLVDQARQRSDTAARQAGKPLAHSDRLLADTLREMRRSLGLEPALSTEPSGDRLHPGDQVYVRSFDRNGVINEIYDRDVLVTLGNLKTLVPVSDVVRHGAATGPSSVKPARARKAHAKSAEHDHEPATVSAQPEVDVRGMRVDEAWPLVDKALDDASLAGLSELRVIHGRGTGQLMRGIREFLDGHPQVGSVTFAGDREGGDGVTVVRIA